ncbi:hypothetical protein Ancab_013117 [Ancistrocladus abbreviatus]
MIPSWGPRPWPCMFQRLQICVVLWVGVLLEAHVSEVRPTSPVSCLGLEAHAQTPFIPQPNAGLGPSSGDCLGAQKLGEIRSSQGTIRGLALACSGKQVRTRGKKRMMEEILQLRLSKRNYASEGEEEEISRTAFRVCFGARGAGISGAYLGRLVPSGYSGRIAEMESRDAAIVNRNYKEEQTNVGQGDVGVL